MRKKTKQIMENIANRQSKIIGFLTIEENTLKISEISKKYIREIMYQCAPSTYSNLPDFKGKTSRFIKKSMKVTFLKLSRKYSNMNIIIIENKKGKYIDHIFLRTNCFDVLILKKYPEITKNIDTTTKASGI